MSRLGADVAELEAIAAELLGYARRLDGARAGIDREIARATWTGPDADAFRRRWRTIAIRDLDGFRADLVTSASELRRQALQQRIASSDGIGAVSGLVAARGAGWAGSGVVGGVLAAGGSHLVAGAVVASRGAIDARTAITRTKHVVGSLLTGGGALSKDTLLEVGVRKGTLSAVGFALTFGSTAIAAGFDRWGEDGGSDLRRSERVARAGAEGALAGGVVAGGAKAGAWAGTKGGALAGAKIGVVLGPKGVVVGAAVGAVVGAVGGSFAGSSAGQAVLNSGIGRKVTEGTVAGAGKAARSVVDGVGGAVSSVKGWFK